MKVILEGTQYDVSLRYNGKKDDEIRALNPKINSNGLETELLKVGEIPLKESIRIRFGQIGEKIIDINYDEKRGRREIIINEDFWDVLNRYGKLHFGTASWDILMEVNLF